MAQQGVGDSCYFDDLLLGQRYVSSEITMDQARMIEFAQEFDPQPFHTDPVAAEDTFFHGLAASGWHTAAVSMRLLTEGGAPKPIGGLIGAGGELIWPQPTRAGDVLHVESEVIELRRSRSKPDRGLVKLRAETKNQRGEVVQIFTVTLVLPTRSADA